MKVSDLLNEQITTAMGNVRRWSREKIDHIRDLEKQPSHKFQGMGSYGYVYKKDDPHEMDRVMRTSEQQEGGMIYQLEIYKNKRIQSNPFLPKILNVENIDSEFPIVHMEPLVEFSTQKIIDNDQLMRHLQQQYFIEPNPKYVGAPLHVQILYDLKLSLRRNENIRDPQLAQAFDFIRALADKHNMWFDLHAENVMWRLTPTGAQLVITDPVVKH